MRCKISSDAELRLKTGVAATRGRREPADVKHERIQKSRKHEVCTKESMVNVVFETEMNVQNECTE